LSLRVTLILLFPTWYHTHLPIFWVISHMAVYCDDATIFGTFHGRWAWNCMWNRKMSQIFNETGPFSFRLTLIFLFSNWYHPHHPIYWVIPHLTVLTAPKVWLMHCVKYGHYSRFEIERLAKNGTNKVLWALDSHIKQGIMLIFQYFVGHLSCKNLKWWMTLLY
jgi:hypothetical protein